MRYELRVYFDGPLSRFHPRGIDDREVILRKQSRFQSYLLGWVKGRMKGFQNCKFEIRPL
jgi:hypothetical protein